MARKTISQRIALVGGDEIKKQLTQFGKAGEDAFSDVQKAAEKLKGPGADFARSMDAAQKKIRELGESVENAGRKMRDFGAGMSVAVTAPLLLMGKKSVDAWRVQEEAIQRVNAALLSTGGSVGFSSEQLQTMASELQKVTTFGDEAILKMQAVLLTFTKVKGDQFRDANMAILDLSAALSMDLQSAAIQVGKALNDPIAGINSLTRSGVSFTAEQKNMVRQLVETGKTAQAQELILREINVQFGGMAAKLAETDFGRYDQALNDLGDSFEEVGRALMPVITRLAELTLRFSEFLKTAVQAFSALPASGQNAILILGGIVTAAGPVLVVLGAMTMGIGGLTTGIAAMLPMMVGAAGAFAALGTAVTATLASAMAFLGWPALLAAALGALVVSVYTHRAAIMAALVEMFDTIKGGARAAWESLPLGLREAVASIREAFGQMADYIAGQFQWLDGKISSVVEGIRSRVQSVLSLIGLADSQASTAGAQRFASGGAVRGPGTSTSDSILARLSDGEFVVRARAVKHYGADLLRRLNSMSLPRGGLLGGYAAGGLVSGSTAPVAAGSAGPSGPYANLNLSIGGESFSGLMAPRETADRLVRFALHEEAKSAGRRPGWYRGA